jgi:hypothetical protein
MTEENSNDSIDDALTRIENTVTRLRKDVKEIIDHLDAYYSHEASQE